MIRRRARAAAVALVAAALVLVPATQAVAHDYLVASTPAAGSTITAAPSAVSLTFDESVLDFGRGSDGVTVTDAAGRHFETACATVSGATVSAAVALGGPGAYTVAWRVVSADGHPVTDAITFTYRPAAERTASPGSAHGPDCGVAVRPTASTAPPGGDTGVVLLIAVSAGLLVLIGAALVIAVVVLRRRPPAAP